MSLSCCSVYVQPLLEETDEEEEDRGRKNAGVIEMEDDNGML